MKEKAFVCHFEVVHDEICEHIGHVVERAILDCSILVVRAEDRQSYVGTDALYLPNWLRASNMRLC